MRTTHDDRQSSNPDGDNGGRRHPLHHGRGRGPGGGGFGEASDRRQYRRGGFGGRGPAGFGPGEFGPGGLGGGGFGPDDSGHLFGPRGPRHGGGPRGPRGRGFRARKGDIRLAILSILGETPGNGYGLMQAIAEKTGGAWRPSPGSVYPTLAQLVDENLIVTTGEGDNDRRSAFALTAAGTSYVAEQAAAIQTAWNNVAEDPEAADPLAVAARKLVGVIRQMDSDGTDEQRAQAVKQIDTVRRSLYRMLGE